MPLVGELVLRGEINNPAATFPLSRCEGDCDWDFDCASDLICL